MSQENVEIVRRGWDAWLRGDLSGVFRQYDAEVVWDLSHYRDAVESEFRGIESIERSSTIGSPSGMTTKSELTSFSLLPTVAS